MPKPNAFKQNCPSSRILERLGERWAMLLLVRLSDGPVRYLQLQRDIEGITKKMLTQTLRRLERDGFVVRQTIRLRPLAVEYALTPRGREVTPLIVQLKRWAEQNWRAIGASNAAFDGGHFQVPN
ncbi:MAG: helix-turn-helix domain-containing protein [Kofleriaceae bacterium]